MSGFWDDLKGAFIDGKKDSDIFKMKENVKVNVRDYHPKIMVAWDECLKGNLEIAKWLIQNGYEELVNVRASLFGEQRANEKLKEKGFVQFIAFVAAIREQEGAKDWLQKNKFDQLYAMAIAITGDENGWKWIRQNSSEDIFMITQTIKYIVDNQRTIRRG